MTLLPRFLHRLTSLTQSVSAFSANPLGWEEQSRADRCAASEIRAEHARTRELGWKISGARGSARAGAEDMRPAIGKDAGRVNSSAIRATEDAEPRGFVASARARKRGLVGCVAVAMGLFLTATAVPAASAAGTESPWWHLTQRLAPSRIEPEGEATLIVQAINLGNAPTSGPLTFTDQLPPNATVKKVFYIAQTTEAYPGLGSKISDLGPSGPNKGLGLCQLTANQVSCSSLGKLGEEIVAPLPPYGMLEMQIKLKLGSGAEAAELNQLTAAGGGAAALTQKRPLPVSEAPIPFGVEHFDFAPETQGGQTATRAGSHPYQLTNDLSFNSLGLENFNVPGLPRDLHFNLPPGQIGNALATPTCSAADFSAIAPGGGTNFCPADTVLGVTVLNFATLNDFENHAVVPIFNLAPAFGEPARFGFEALQNPVILDTAIRSGKGEDNGVTVTAANITQLVAFQSATATFWGAPADSSHDSSRGWGCLLGGLYRTEKATTQPCTPANQPKPPAFLTLPTDCAAAYVPTLDGIAWPSRAFPAGAGFPTLSSPLADLAGNPLGLTACNQVPFAPTVHSEPTSNAATSPTGLSFAINFEDEGLLSAEGVAQSQIKRAVVTLPQGFTTNPSVAEGLKACTEAEYDESSLDGSKGCTPESKVGDVVIESPLVAQKVLGSLFVAKQGENPNPTPQNPRGNLLTIYLVARNPELGIIIKQALRVTPDPVTGQLTTEVDNIPELPFSHFELAFRTGQRAPLVTPPACGTYTVKALMYPWSNPTAPVERSSSFQITSGPEGQGCPSGGVPPFHPGLEAGTLNNAAGTYSPFYTHITRKDSEQEITHFSIKLPPGVSGKLAGIPECSDAAIAAAKAREHEGGGQEELNSPSCPAASEVGRSLVGSGVGNVLAYAPGKMYLAGPYHGSNLSLVSITAAKVGPFDLGTVVVRFALKINPETAEVSVDGQGSDPIPHIVDGIPVHLRDIRAYVDRPNFVFNPTSCAKTSTAATVLGSGLNFASEADDQPVTVTSPFQAADCASLGFAPKLALSLKGGTKRGATPAFKAVVTYPKGGAYANIREAQVTLPSSEYLEQAHIGTVCTRVQFAQGTVPGEKCPAASIYGRAKAVTPILSEPLEGPVYLRSSSHPLPDLVAALNNKQVNIDLDGHIDAVHKKGSEVSRIRNSFEMVPDAPVTSFTLEMQGGKKGLLTNSTNLCKGTHRATADFTGQNGKLHEFNPPLAAQCGKKGKKK